MPNATSPKPLIIAHRGASGYRPEHTRGAYELALAMGADAVEPDIVPTRDGVLVIRHENEVSGTTDVASRPEFADRKTTKTVDGQTQTGWFTEDFTWAELSTLRARERLPKVRPDNTAFDGVEGILRLSDLLAILDGADRQVGLVAEIKHATYFESIGLPIDELFAAELRDAGWDDDPRLTIESFELPVLHRLRERGVRGDLIYLIEAQGAPADQVARHGDQAMPYAEYLSPAGLASLASGINGISIDGISVDKSLLLDVDAAGNTVGVTDLVERAHAAGLTIFCWTLRPENRFLGKNLRREDAPGGLGDWRTEFQLIMASGIDGVFADHPDLAHQARSSLSAL